MQKKKIILLESSAYKEYKVPEIPSNRVAALSPATVALLERLTLFLVPSLIEILLNCKENVAFHQELKAGSLADYKESASTAHQANEGEL